MNRIKHIRLYSLIVILLSILMGVKTSFAAFASSDLEGVWQLHILTSLGEWVRGPASIDASGNLSFIAETAEGDSEEITGEIIISSKGIIAMTDSPDFQGVMSTDKNIIVMTDTLDEEEAEYALFLGVKQGSGAFSPSDLAGTWHGHNLVSGLWEGWAHETGTFDNAGNSSDLQYVQSDGETGTHDPVTLDLSNSGFVTITQHDSFQGVMNNSKNLLVFTSTQDEGICETAIFMKEGGTFSPSDLAGTWIGHSLVVGDWRSWIRSNLAIDTAGNFSFTYVDPDGNSGSDADTVDISETGIITSENSPAMHGVMNMDKNIIAMTETWDENVYAFTVFVKSKRTTVSGTVSLADGTPLVAMVLANGQYMFSNNPVGEYDLDVPLNANGEITLYAFCGGQAPFKATLTPPEASFYEITMEAASPDSKVMNVTAELEESTLKSGWMLISGQITTEGGTPLIAMVLANGKQMFSNNPVGEYALDVPLNANGEITLYVFGGGHAPFKAILSVN